MDYNSLNVDTRFNIIFLRADLHVLLDSHFWVLMPEPDIVDKIYDRVVLAQSNRQPLPITQEYGPSPSNFTYRLVPIKPMTDILISRVNRHSSATAGTAFSHHEYPFSTLGPVQSHAHPHFVIYNAGERLISMNLFTLMTVVGSCMGISPDSALRYLIQIQLIYRSWRAKAPSSFQHGLHNKRPRPDSEKESDWHDAGNGGRSFRPRDDTCPASKRGDGSTSGASAHTSEFGARRFASTPCDFDTPRLESGEPESCCGSTTSLEDCNPCDVYVSQRVEDTEGAAVSEGGWEPAVVNDGQLGDYVEEQARSPWPAWHAPRMRRGLEGLSKPPPDTTTFSSNDWSLYDYCVFLTQPS